MTAEGWPILVIGLDPVGLAVVHRLHALRLPVRVLASPDEQQRHGGELASLGVEVLQGSAASVADLSRVDLESCGSVVLASDDQAFNVDACLVIRRQTGDLPVVVRVADATLVRFLRMGVPHVHVYSMGSTTAPVAADMAIHLLGEHKARAPVQRRRPALHRLPRASVLLLWVMAVLGLTLVPATLYFASALKTKMFPAFYTAWTTLFSAGHGDPRFLHAPTGVRLVAMGLSVVGPLLLAAAIGLVVDWLLMRRFAAVVSGMAVRMQGHVVVFGAGNVGARVAELLHQRKVKVVVVESNATLRNVQRLRTQGISVVVGDATVEDTLDLAGAWWAGVALALTNSDAVNLHVGLQMSDRKIGVPAVVRLLSPELTEQLGGYPDLTPLSPVAETASHVCRTVEHLRSDRLKARQAVVQPPEAARTTGRFAGPEFQSAAVVGDAAAVEPTAPEASAEAAAQRGAVAAQPAEGRDEDGRIGPGSTAARGAN